MVIKNYRLRKENEDLKKQLLQQKIQEPKEKIQEPKEKIQEPKEKIQFASILQTIEPKAHISSRFLKPSGQTLQPKAHILNRLETHEEKHMKELKAAVYKRRMVREFDLFCHWVVQRLEEKDRYDPISPLQKTLSSDDQVSEDLKKSFSHFLDILSKKESSDELLNSVILRRIGDLNDSLEAKFQSAKNASM